MTIKIIRRVTVELDDDAARAALRKAAGAPDHASVEGFYADVTVTWTERADGEAVADVQEVHVEIPG